MARSGKSINVKIATSKVIKALEDKLTQLEKDYKEQGANELKYNKAVEKWRKEVLAYALANIKKAENLRTNYRSWNNQLNIDFDLTVSESDLPVEPTKDYEFIHASTYRETKSEINNALRILRMTDEETVSTSTYNTIAQYL